MYVIDLEIHFRKANTLNIEEAEAISEKHPEIESVYVPVISDEEFDSLPESAQETWGQAIGGKPKNLKRFIFRMAAGSVTEDGQKLAKKILGEEPSIENIKIAPKLLVIKK